MKRISFVSIPTLLCLILVSAAIPSSSAQTVGSSAPFSFSITPSSVNLKPGDQVTYHITIDASSGFADKVSFTLQISALAYSTTLDLGSVNPPYPKAFDYSYTLPSDIPVSVTAKGICTATSGVYSQTQEVQISIQSQSATGDILGQIVKIFNDFWNWLMHLLGR